MGGNTFDDTVTLTTKEFNNINDFITNSNLTDNIDFLLPFRLQNKVKHGDFDLIVHDDEEFIKLFEDNNLIKEIKTIPLFEDRFGLYSKHILTNSLHQIDLLKSWNKYSMEITRAFFLTVLQIYFSKD